MVRINLLPIREILRDAEIVRFGWESLVVLPAVTVLGCLGIIVLSMR